VECDNNGESGAAVAVRLFHKPLVLFAASLSACDIPLAAQRSIASVAHSCRRYAGHVQNTIKFLSMSAQQARSPRP